MVVKQAPKGCMSYLKKNLVCIATRYSIDVQEISRILKYDLYKYPSIFQNSKSQNFNKIVIMKGKQE